MQMTCKFVWFEPALIVIFTGILQLFFIVILHSLPCHAPDKSYNQALPCRLHLHDVNRHLIKVQDIDEDLVCNLQ